MKQKEFENIEQLMYHIQKNNYKEMCDQIKVNILDKLIKLADNHGSFITSADLKKIRNGIDQLRTKEKELETEAIVSVIDNLISRGDNCILERKKGV